MYLIVGLGNPGAEYTNTPHNLGFLTVDWLAESCGATVRRPECNTLVGSGRIGNCPVVLAKPLSYVNRSGGPVRALLEKYGLAGPDLVLIYDELNLPWTSLRIRRRGSAGGHHGVESVIEALASQDFTRVRLGVGPGHPVRDGAEFVLTPFRRSQQKELEEFLERAVCAVRSIIADGAAKAMTMYNRRARDRTTEVE